MPPIPYAVAHASVAHASHITGPLFPTYIWHHGPHLAFVSRCGARKRRKVHDPPSAMPQHIIPPSCPIACSVRDTCTPTFFAATNMMCIQYVLLDDAQTPHVMSPSLPYLLWTTVLRPGSTFTCRGGLFLHHARVVDLAACVASPYVMVKQHISTRSIDRQRQNDVQWMG